jgi:RNA polymerase sigma-70 factor (ECF subfamily)
MKYGAGDMESDMSVMEESGARNDRFAALVSRYAGPMLAAAYRYTFDWESAKDLCQDTWLKVYEKISMYDGRVPFERWLFAVHRNGCLDFLRKRKRRMETPGTMDIFESADTGPDRRAELSQTRERILKAASGLPDRQRTVFALIDLEQMSVEEASGILGIRPVTVRTNLYHARKRIAGILRGSEEQP